MTREELNSMIECQGVYEIIYRKDGNERQWHISHIEVSDKYLAGQCILAYCYEVEKDLTFSISEIISATRYWIDVLDEKLEAQEDGIFVLACVDDNHIGRRLAYIKRGERFHDFGWVLAYHCVPAFIPDSLEGWKKIDDNIPNSFQSLYAYIGDTDNNDWRFLEMKNNGGINYYLCANRGTNNQKLPSDDTKREIKVIGRYDIPIYDVPNLRVHFDLQENHNTKLGSSSIA